MHLPSPARRISAGEASLTCQVHLPSPGRCSLPHLPVKASLTCQVKLPSPVRWSFLHLLGEASLTCQVSFPHLPGEASLTFQVKLPSPVSWSCPHLPVEASLTCHVKLLTCQVPRCSFPSAMGTVRDDPMKQAFTWAGWGTPMAITILQQ